MSSVSEMNRNILAALQTVVDLPPGITSLKVSIGLNQMPELRIVRLIVRKDNDVTEVLTVTKRYRLAEIKADEEIDITTFADDSKQFAIGRRA